MAAKGGGERERSCWQAVLITHMAGWNLVSTFLKKLHSNHRRIQSGKWHLRNAAVA